MKTLFGASKVTFCRGVNKLFKLISTSGDILKPVPEQETFIGWYDPGVTSDLQPDSSGNVAAGQVAVFYWNGLIDRYNPSGGAFNDYSKASYLTALNNYLAIANKKIIVDLPYWDVSGTYTVNLTDWWADIINATKNNPKVIGYYLFDEPEVWGYFNSIPELTHTEAMRCYNIVKGNTTKDTYSVFTDVDLFNSKYGSETPFWDVFMFDAYDFLTQNVLDTRCNANPVWCYTAGSQDELDWVEARLLKWKTDVITPMNIERVVFVMQGHGETRQDPVTGVSTTDPSFVFGMRTMTNSEYTFIIDKLKANFNLEGLLAWSWFFANDASRERANTALLRFKN
jgi:hypothetical protein